MQRLILFAAVMMISAVTLYSQSNEYRVPDQVNLINKDSLISNIIKISSDEFEGRAPASKGEKLTLDYLTKKYSEAGALPGNGNSYLQRLEITEVYSEAPEYLYFKGKGSEIKLKHAEEFTAQSRRITPDISLSDAELVFAGYGIVAPEYNWNDYAGIDWKNKIAVVFVNDPGYETGDSALFTGKAMTYYGRWTYKYEEAARQGAAGILIIHETGPASYPWEVVKNGWTGTEYYVVSAMNNMERSAVEGWITDFKAKELFTAAGYDFDALRKRAVTPGFRPFSLGFTTDIKIINSYKATETHNFIAKIPGTKRSEEYIIYTAHYDHLGIDTTLTGDQIYNGARDNASGTAALIEIARAFANLQGENKNERTIVFIGTGAEERGLLGAEYYTANPVYPLEQTVAVINIDGLNIYGPTKDITQIGKGLSALDSYVEKAASIKNKYVSPDMNPASGGFFRSDHFPFAKKGVPAMYLGGGREHSEFGFDYMKKKNDEWGKTKYHRVGDEYDESYWDLSGAMDDIKIGFMIGHMLSRTTSFPEWNEGTAFKTLRDKMLKVKAD